jgi:hypothetical protein
MVSDYLYLYNAFLLFICVCLLASLTRSPIYVYCILYTHQYLLDLRYALDGQVTLACAQCLTNGIRSAREWITRDTIDNYQDT